jgi:hypothetical protein
MKKLKKQKPEGLDVFKTSAVIGSTFGKTPVRTWLAKPAAQAAKRAAGKKSGETSRVSEAQSASSKPGEKGR